jgi:hypothetical protein
MTQFSVGQRISSAALNLMTPGPWVPIAPTGGWSNHFGGTAQFQFRQLNPTEVEVIGELGGPGTVAAGTNIGFLPFALAPANAQRVPAIITAGTGQGTCFLLTVISAGASVGALQLSVTITGATVFAFRGVISLDA